MASKRLVQAYKHEKLRNYEISAIISHTLSEKALKEKINQLKEIIQTCNAEGMKTEVVAVETTKLRTFCTSIKKDKKGYYACFYTKAAPQLVAIINKKLTLEENILRTLIVLARKKKESYGIFSKQYETDGYKTNNNCSYDDPNGLAKKLGENARIAEKKSTQGKKIQRNLSKKQRAFAKVIKLSRTFGLLPYFED